MKHHYFVSFAAGSAFGSIGIETAVPLNTVARIKMAEADLLRTLTRQHGQVPGVVILNIIACEAPGPIIEVPGGALRQNGVNAS